MDRNTGTEPDGRASQPPPAAMTAAPGGLCWRREFPGEMRRMSEVRAWLTSLLPACPARDDVLSIATELGANAVRHTASGHGGSFTIEIAWTPRVARVAVADGGGLTEPQVTGDLLSEHGRGLVMVRGLATRTGVDGDQHGRRVWAEVAWDGPKPAGLALVPVPGDGAVSGERSSGPPQRTVTRAVVPVGGDLMTEVPR